MRQDDTSLGRFRMLYKRTHRLAQYLRPSWLPCVNANFLFLPGQITQRKHKENRKRNKAISYCNGEWIFSLDSDERCTEAVRDEILALIENAPLDIYRVPRKNYFMGRWIKHSGWYPNFRQPQLFRNGKMSYDLKPVHEGFVSHSDKKIGVISNIIWQFPFKNTEEVIHKANRYSTLGVEKLQDKGETGGVFKAFLHGFWSFIKHYIFKLGFLDGGPGFVIAFGNFEGTFYRYIKLTEAQANWKVPSVKPIHKPKQ